MNLVLLMAQYHQWCGFGSAVPWGVAMSPASFLPVLSPPYSISPTMTALA